MTTVLLVAGIVLSASKKNHIVTRIKDLSNHLVGDTTRALPSGRDKRAESSQEARKRGENQ